MNKEKLFNTISQICLTSEELEIGLFKIIEELTLSLKVDTGFIYLSEDKEIFVKTISYGAIELPQKIEKGKRGIGFWLFEEKPAILLGAEVPEIKGISSSMIVPIYDKRGLKGICGLLHSNAIFNENDLCVFSQIASFINLYLELSRVSKDLYENVLFPTVQTLISVVEAIDPNLRDHSWNTARYAVCLASKMNLGKLQIEAIKYAGLLHGVGRIGIPDKIWRKEGPLESDELKAMRTHPLIGEKIVKNINFPFDVASIVRSHHENYDGTGYPDELKGKDIPLGARIVFLANAYDAMTSERPYRKSKTVEEAISEIKSKRGTQFDPEITDIFLSIIEKR